MTPEEELEYLRAKVTKNEMQVMNANMDLAFALSLPPILEKALRLLLKHTRVTTEQLKTRLPRGSEPKCCMFRLRKVLQKRGVELKSQRYLGYWIEPEDKKKLLEAAVETLSRKTHVI